MDAPFIAILCALAILLISRFLQAGSGLARARKAAEYALSGAVLLFCLAFQPFLWQGAFCIAAAALAISNEKRLAAFSPLLAAMSASPYGMLLCTCLFMLAYEGGAASISIGIPIAYAGAIGLSNGAFLLEDFGSAFVYLLTLASFLAFAFVLSAAWKKSDGIRKYLQARLPSSSGASSRPPS
jgi:hypothetical protein